jgi:hypothetical protein
VSNDHIRRKVGFRPAAADAIFSELRRTRRDFPDMRSLHTNGLGDDRLLAAEWEEQHVRKTHGLKTELLGMAMVAATGLAIGLTAHAQGQQQILVIEGGTLIDGNGGAPVPNSVIVRSLVA